MFDHIQQKRIVRPEISENRLAYIGDFTFEIWALAMRHVIKTRGNSRLKNTKSSSSRRSH